MPSLTFQVIVTTLAALEANTGSLDRYLLTIRCSL